MKYMQKNKKGMAEVLLVFLVLALFLALAFGGALFVSISNNIVDEFEPVVNDLGVISGNGKAGDNLTENAKYLFDPLNTVTTSFNWILGVGYALSLFLVIALAVSFRATGQKYMIPFFLLLVLLMFMLSIMVSNTYEDLYNSNDVIGDGLKDQGLVSWLIINSPLVSVIVMFIAGAIMFSTREEEVFT
jgi:hypothetical protein